jgi:hypothetical protein
MVAIQWIAVDALKPNARTRTAVELLPANGIQL